MRVVFLDFDGVLNDERRPAAALVEAARFDGVKVQAFDTGDPALPDSITRPIYIRG